MSLEKLPIPGPGEYLAAIGEVSYGFIANGGVVKSVQEYMKQQGKLKNCTTNGFIDRIEGVAGRTLPIDRQLGEVFEEHDSMSKAIVLGSIAGAMVVDVAYFGLVGLLDIHDNMPDFYFSDSEDEAEKNHNIAQSMLELGDKGMRIIGDLAEAEVEEWEREAIKDVVNQRYFRSGFGTVILGAHSKHKNTIEEDFTNYIVSGQHDRDWDFQLEQLLGNQPPD